MDFKKNTLNINPFGSYVFLTLCAFSLMSIADYVSASIVVFQKGLLAALTVVSLILYLKNNKVSKLFLSICFFWGIIAFSTMIHDGDYLQLIRAVFSSLLLCITYELGYKTNKYKTLKAFTLTWGVITVLNSATMFYYYSPNPLMKGMYRDGGGDSNYYLLGQDNGTIFYTIPASIVVMLYSIEKKKKISMKAIVYLLFIGLAYFRVFSGAGILSFAAIIALAIVSNNEAARSYLSKRLTIKKIYVVLAVVFLIIVLLRSNNFVIDIIANVLEKNSTFTGRTQLWDVTIAHIINSPIIGYGLQKRALRIQMIPYGKAHNMILQIAFNGGIASLITYCFIGINSFRNHNNENRYEKTIIIGSYFILLLVSNFDFYIHHQLTFLPMILFTLYSGNKSKHERISINNSLSNSNQK